MKPEFELPAADPVRDDTSLRVLMLGAVYAAAIVFAVAFSPNMGFATPDAAPPPHLASAAQPASTGR